MANDIERKDLYQRLANIKTVERWLQCAETLGLRVCRGSKHPSTIRNPEMPDDNGQASLITVVPNNLYKEMNQRIFKELVKFKIKEDDIWKDLDML